MTRSAIQPGFSLDRPRGGVRQSRRRSIECRRPRSSRQAMPTRRLAAWIDAGSIDGTHASHNPPNTIPDSSLTGPTPTHRSQVTEPIAASSSMADCAADCRSASTPIPTAASRNQPTNPPLAAFFLASNLANGLPSCQLPRGPKTTHPTARKSIIERGLNAIQTTVNDGLPNRIHIPYLNAMDVFE